METPEKYVNKFAVNEQQQLGLIVEYEQLNDQIVYLGIPVSKDASNWVSINPLVLMNEVDVSSLMEIVMLLTPPEKVIKHPDGTHSISVSSVMMPNNPLVDWNNSMPDINNIKTIFDTIFKPPSVKPPEAKDFTLDGEDSEPEDDGA